jgi:hypothetical protein
MSDPPVRMVVADDFPLMRDGMADSLQRDPRIEVVGLAGDGDAALAAARELEPDVLVLDLRMPGVSAGAGSPPDGGASEDARADGVRWRRPGESVRLRGRRRRGLPVEARRW